MTKNKGKIVLFLLMVAVFSGCATRVSVNAQRTPTLDTSGIRRISIMPFEASSYSYQNAARHATAVATSRIQATNHFVLVNTSDVQRLRQTGQSIESHVDALFTGQITHINSNTSNRSYQRTDRQTGVTTTHVTYTREVEVQFNYSLVRARDGSLIGPINKRGTTSSSSENPGELPSVDTLVAQVIDSQLRQLGNDVAPHTISISRTLEKEPNKALRKQMKPVLKQVKSGNYRPALESFLAMYSTHKNIAAAINAAILYEVLGEIRAGANFMQTVFSETGNPKAREMLASLNRELREIAGTAEFRNTRSQAERVTNHANAEIRKVLPNNARVWIHNNSTANSNQGRVNDVIDDLISLFIRDGITVIDRQSIDLIMAEQNFQVGGFVNDNDLVNIGNLAGANTIVLINITGTGATRRLQVRVLDIETGVPIFQSDTSESWMI